MSKLACIVNDCKGKDSGAIRLYKFPSEKLEILEMWIENLQIPQGKVLPTSKICSRHFDPSCIGKKYLLKGAIPTLNLGHSDDDIHLPSIHTSKRYRNCSIEGCTSQSRDYVFHEIPTDRIARKAWLEIFPIKEHMQDFVHLFVCDKHFDVPQKRAAKESIHSLKKQSHMSEQSVEIDQELHNNSVSSCDKHNNLLQKRLGKESIPNRKRERQTSEQSVEIDQELHYNADSSCDTDFDLPQNRLDKEMIPNLKRQRQMSEQSIEIDQELHNYALSCKKCENYCKLADYNKKQCNALQSSMKALEKEVNDLKSKILVLEIELSNFKKADIIPCKIKTSLIE